MKPVWMLHKAARGLLPVAWIKRLRRLAEVYSDALWCTDSFSEHGEDRVLNGLLLRRAQREGVTDARPGFYVDVGAFSPKQYSNTYSFYRAGWRGINIDATPGSMAVFGRARPRDINLECVVSDSTDELTFYSFGNPTVINTLSADHAAEFAQKLGVAAHSVTVQPRSLASLLDEHLPADQAIDFMSVDAETHDLQVLQSNDWTRFRPQLVIVEVLIDAHDEMLKSEVCSFMFAQGYALVTWVYPNVIFERIDDASAERTKRVSGWEETTTAQGTQERVA
jgi:hypothetical protein